MMRRRSNGWWLGVALVALAGLIQGCEGGGEDATPPATSEGGLAVGGGAAPAPAAGSGAPGAATTALPEVDTSAAPIKVQMKIVSARQAAQAAPDDANRVADLGALFYVHGYPRAAVDCFQRATELAAGEYLWWYALGLAYRQNGQPREAIRAFERALAISADYRYLHRQLAELYAETGNTTQAQEQRRQLSRVEESGDPVDTVEFAIRRKGFDLDVMLAEAVAKAKQGDFATAESILQEAQSMDEEGYRTRAARGMLAALQGQFEKALGELRAVVEAQPAYLQAKFDLARVTLQMGNAEEAETLLRQILEVEPGNLEALGRYVELVRGQERTDAARELLEAALASAPGNARLHHEVGLMLAQLGAIDQATAAVRKAVELDPFLARAHQLLGMLLYQQDQHDGAEEQWRAALAAAPRYLPPRIALYQMLWYEKKQYAAAEQLLREGYELMPTSAVLANSYAWLLATSPDASLRKPDEAVSVAQKACQLTEYNDHALLDTLAAAYASAGQYEEARKWVAQAIQKGEEVVAAARVAQSEASVQRVGEMVEEYKKRKALYEQDQAFVSE